ncbi:MAG: hypothetical protein A2381_19025 [Bdellovibrionales bacterium RIFOXYB1_FULL_37_110]|nr:MAG: hypothetical protein A2417_13075 [Bdellovibrionales bacterium RIFOXYC1_FULL_37_79]OFZ59886.1 MAG: hypothetical protein A2381_19025 [Bdellovibrionales bacterium RIFOXYB1_FULL_37_110]OFZ63507.1 MAG: hypothetical protein A2577_06475 [Bdellovibrionales bacterium RIFOXYD1_FULL_36_51]
MGKRFEKLIIDEEFKTWGKMMEAICNVKIYQGEEVGTYDVILTRPEHKDYHGIWTTMFFEFFATRIRDKYLKSVPAEKINWYDNWREESPYRETITELSKVFMQWNGEHYRDPNWLYLAQ